MPAMIATNPAHRTIAVVGAPADHQYRTRKLPPRTLSTTKEMHIGTRPRAIGCRGADEPGDWYGFTGDLLGGVSDITPIMMRCTQNHKRDIAFEVRQRRQEKGASWDIL